MVVGSIDEPLPESCFREVVSPHSTSPRVRVRGPAQWPCERARKTGTNRGEKTFLSDLVSASQGRDALRRFLRRRPAGRSRNVPARAPMMACSTWIRPPSGATPLAPPAPCLWRLSRAAAARLAGARAPSTRRRRPQIMTHTRRRLAPVLDRFGRARPQYQTSPRWPILHTQSATIPSYLIPPLLLAAP